MQFSDILKSNQIPTQVAPAGYLALLAHVKDEDHKIRLGVSIYPPDQVSDHIKLFEEWLQSNHLADLASARQRLEFLMQAEKHGCAVVEIQSPFLPTDETTVQKNWEIYRNANLSEHENTQIILPDFETTGEAVTFFGEKSKQEAAQQLREEIRVALESGEPITIGNQARHDVITEVLHELVFSPEPENRTVTLRIAYVDGTECEPFPIFCLPKVSSSELDNNDFLSSALMSIRHYELDEQIDFCWFRNREVSQSRTLAESDLFCYKTSQAQLRLLLGQSDFRLNLYHTGFEPAVIGFYRALVKVMKEKGPGRIVVRPMYYRGDSTYEAGSLWVI